MIIGICYARVLHPVGMLCGKEKEQRKTHTQMCLLENQQSTQQSHNLIMSSFLQQNIPCFEIKKVEGGNVSQQTHKQKM